MTYIQRAMEKDVSNVSKSVPVVMVCGPRQVGKSTMLEHIMEPGRTYVSLRDDEALDLAKNDPRRFFERYRPPVLIDEFQLAPSIMSTIEYLSDEKKRLGEDSAGMFWLTGSQKFAMMKTASDSLVGRCTTFDMSSLSTAELEGIDAGFFNPEINELEKRAGMFPLKGADEIFERICLGSMPVLNTPSSMTRERFYRDYRDLYLKRDVLELANIDKYPDFQRFLTYMAECTGQELNFYGIGRNLGISSPTIKKWVGILDMLGVIFIIPPYFDNGLKSLVKTPKFYFTDTGLAAYLCKLKSGEDIQKSNKAGAFFETYVVSEIMKSYCNHSKDLDLYYYRDAEKREIDLIIAEGRKLYPIEIKLSHSPAHADKNLYVLKSCDMEIQPAVIISLSDIIRPYGKDAWLYPASAI
ncbi:MAG: DUF4143 domain-containing protein [Clostridia bacterium]|nr:DUF4143 domain-containing protein [Clostridia bacterium]